LRIKVTGCLSRAGYKGDARDRLQLIAQTLDTLNQD
ncbi:MAG: primosomal replication protein N, partial [Alcanivorax sp.]|nr:primosomal replication protein N [Alcanivorax sp.]